MGSEASSGRQGSVSARIKPRLRGVSHEYAFYASLIAGPVLMRGAATPRAALAATVYGVCLSALLGASALYHRVTWTPRARYWMGRLDLAMIFTMIAGSYTPIALLVLEPPLATLVLWGAWLLAAAGILLKIFWVAPSKKAIAVVYVTMGSLGVFLMPAIAHAAGLAPVTLLAAGGALYVAGAAVYAFQRPDPLPAVFGYHEIFHALVIVAAALHYIAMAAYLLRVTA
jgi:hemolysin III